MQLKLISSFLCLLLLAGCASQPAKIKETRSGWPEVEISTSDKTKVKQNIISRNAQTGWALEQETDSSLLFTKIDDTGSMGAIMTQAIIGNAYSTPPVYEARYIISQANEQVSIVVNISVSTQMAMGQTNRILLNKNNAVFNAFQQQLERVKSETE